MRSILFAGLLIVAPAVEASTVLCTALCRTDERVNNSSQRVFSVVTATGDTVEAAVIELNRKCVGGYLAGGIAQFPSGSLGNTITSADFSPSNSCVALP